MKKLYVVTGANGHLGKTLTLKLLQQGLAVRALVLPNDDAGELVKAGAEVIYGNVTNLKSLRMLFKIPEDTELYVYHCAGIVSVTSKKNVKVHDVNVTGTKNIADLCLAHHVKKLVYVSSVHAITENSDKEQIFENPAFDPNCVKGDYAKTKAEASKYVLGLTKQGLNAVIVHPSGIIGPNDTGHGHLTHLIIDYLDGTLKACVNGGYDFVDVRDVTDGIISAMEKGRKGQCYILSNKFYSIRNFLKMLSRITGKKPVKVVLPMWLAKGTAPFSEVFYKMIKRPPLYTSYSLYTLTSNSFFSHKKADKELNYKTRSMEETLRDTVAYLKMKKVIAV